MSEFAASASTEVTSDQPQQSKGNARDEEERETMYEVGKVLQLHGLTRDDMNGLIVEVLKRPEPTSVEGIVPRYQVQVITLPIKLERNKGKTCKPPIEPLLNC